MSTRTLVRTNLVLVLLVAVVGWFAWEASRPPPVTPPTRLLAVAPDEVRALRLEHDGLAAPLEFSRSGTDWQVVHEGRRLPADQQRVAALLRLAALESRASYPLADRVPGDYGLEPPRVRMWFDDEAVLLGSQEPLNYRRYVATGGRLHLVDDTVFVHATQPREAYVDPRPATGRGGLVAIDAGAWRLQATDGGWHGSGLADEAIAGRVAAWRDLVAVRVEAARRGTTPGGHVILEFGDGSQQELEVRREDDGATLTAVADGISYRLPAAALPDLGLDG